MATAAKGAKSKTSQKQNQAQKKAPKKGVAAKASPVKSKKAAPAPKPKGKLAALKEALLGKKSATAKKTDKKPENKPEKKLSAKPGKAAEKPAPKPAHAKAAAPAAPAPAPKALKGAKGAAKEAAAKPAKVAKAAKAAKSAGLGVDETVCREVACEGLATTMGYCRLHYIKNWKKIQRKAVILREKKLNQYIEELVAKYPDKYIEAIRQDLENDKDFAKVIRDLDLDESVDEYDVEGEADEGLIDNIRREIEDDGETF